MYIIIMIKVMYLLYFTYDTDFEPILLDNGA